MPNFAGGDKTADMNRAGIEEERCPREILWSRSSDEALLINIPSMKSHFHLLAVCSVLIAAGRLAVCMDHCWLADTSEVAESTVMEEGI